MSDTNINKFMKSLGYLNKRRPPKIDVPSDLCQIGGDVELECNGGSYFTVSGIVGIYSIRGMQSFMEDTYKVVSSPQGKKGFFGVYDGHGGRMAAEYVAAHLDKNIYKMLENCSGNEAKEEAIKAGYLKTDQDFMKKERISGACCVTVLIDGEQIWVSNLGDCRAVLCRGEIVETLTKDHTAADEDERRRIEDDGGNVEMCRGVWRVHGILTVSRSIGDAYSKNWVLAEPETKNLHLTPDMEYLLLASHGFWSEVSNEEIINIVKRSCSSEKKGLAAPKMMMDPINVVAKLPRPTMNIQSPCGGKIHFKEKAHSNGLIDACKELANLAMKRNGLVDITVMIVDLHAFK